MNIIDEIIAFLHSESVHDLDCILEPARVRFTLSPLAYNEHLLFIRYAPTDGPDTIVGYPYTVERQDEPWTAWIEYGSERRRVDRLTKGLLNEGTDERGEGILHSLLADCERWMSERRKAKRAGDAAGVLMAERALHYAQGAIDEALDEFRIPFAVAIILDGVIFTTTHTRYRDDEAMRIRLNDVGRLVAAAEHLIPHERRVEV